MTLLIELARLVASQPSKRMIVKTREDRNGPNSGMIVDIAFVMIDVKGLLGDEKTAGGIREVTFHPDQGKTRLIGPAVGEFDHIYRIAIIYVLFIIHVLDHSAITITYAIYTS